MVGVLREQGARSAGRRHAGLARRQPGGARAAADAHRAARWTVAPEQPVDEIWLQVADGERAERARRGAAARAAADAAAADEFNVVVPRELLAQRYRTQRTFSVVVGSVAALALLVGGIGIMNIMLTSVVERTREIGVRRTVGATRRDVTMQFLIETLLMTVGGGVARHRRSAPCVSVGHHRLCRLEHARLADGGRCSAFVVSFVVGLVFGLYPAMKAAALEPVDAMRYEYDRRTFYARLATFPAASSPALTALRMIRRARRIAVQADRVGLQRDRRSVDGDHLLDPCTILIARSTTFGVSWMTLPGLAREVSEPSGS